MKHWEFLLQQEGDRSWLPLESPDVEILEGRYRVVARSSQKNIEVEIRISHLDTATDPPKRRIQKRSARTNREGLIVIIPYTRLEPGLWELCCSSTDLMSDLVGDAWQYAVKLQVLARESDTEAWDSPWSASAAINSNGALLTDTAESDDAVTPAAVVDQPLPEYVSSETDESPVPEPALLTETVETRLVAADESPAPEPTSTESSSLPPEVAEILGASMDRLFLLAEQMSSQLIDEVMQDLDLATVSSALSQPDAIAIAESLTSPVDQVPSSVSPEIEANPAMGYRLPSGVTPILALEQEALIAGRGKQLTLSGQISVTEGQDGDANQTVLSSWGKPEVADPWDAEDMIAKLTGNTLRELQLCLRDPQTLQVLVSDRLPIPNQLLPFPFSFSFTIPDDVQTHLILGEVLLCGTMAGSTNLTTLTTQAFTITADPQELVGELEKINEALDETLAAQTEEEDRIDLPLEISQKLAKDQELSLNLSFLTPEPAEAAVEPPARFPSLVGQPLPPQLYQPDPTQPRTQISLPGFGFPLNPSEAKADLEADTGDRVPDSATGDPQPEMDTTVAAVTSLVVKPESSADSASAGAELTEASDPTIAEPDLTDENRMTESVIDAKEESQIQADSVESPEEQAEEATVREIDLPCPVQMAFQSLNLQDRFLNRLTSLASDVELSEWLRSNVPPGRAAKSVSKGTATVDKPGRAEQLTAKEIVVDDEQMPVSRDRRRNGSKSSLTSSLDAPNPLILPPDEPVPTPSLEVTGSELVAGKPVNIRVKLPHIEPRIYVKLWVIDRQTRSLLDGPRWLLDFIPNSQGELEALTQLTVPFGSLEVLFEAIAIEMHTQRESHKVSRDRTIIPPDIPVVSLDDFDSRM